MSDKESYRKIFGETPPGEPPIPPVPEPQPPTVPAPIPPTGPQPI